MIKALPQRLCARLLPCALAALAAMAAVNGFAASLGRLSVLSVPGQPLNAVIDLTATPEELNSITARLAPEEEFRRARINMAPLMANLDFAVEKNPNGRSLVRVTTTQPITNSYVDFLIELSWANGKLVREYPFIIESQPPRQAQQQSQIITAPPVSPPVVENKPPAAAAPPVEQPKNPPPSSAQPSPAGKPTSTGSTYLVKRGDYLGRIALAIKPPDVSLDQMLVALTRANPSAFVDGNMNRLHAGAELRLPPKEATKSIDRVEARRVFAEQSIAFDEYRQQLAGRVAPPRPRIASKEAQRQQAVKPDAQKKAQAGKIQPQAKAPPPISRDKLEVSKAPSTQGKKSGAKRTPVEEDLIARDNALKEANNRLGELEKSIADLKKLAEMKGAKPPETPDAKSASAKSSAVQKNAAAGGLAVNAGNPPPTDSVAGSSALDIKKMLMAGGAILLLALIGLVGLLYWRNLAASRQGQSKRNNAVDGGQAGFDPLGSFSAPLGRGSAAATPNTPVTSVPPQISGVDLNLPQDLPPLEKLAPLSPTQAEETVSNVEKTVDENIDLAQAYIEMNERDAARELLNEAAKTGNPAQRKRALDMLAVMRAG